MKAAIVTNPIIWIRDPDTNRLMRVYVATYKKKDLENSIDNIFKKQALPKWDSRRASLYSVISLSCCTLGALLLSTSTITTVPLASTLSSLLLDRQAA